MKGEQPRHEVDRQTQVDQSLEDREVRLGGWQHLLDARERAADEREVIANERERAANERREAEADQREAAWFEEIERVDERVRKISLDVADIVKHTFESGVVLGRAVLEATQDALKRSEEVLERTRERDHRQQQRVQRRSTANERDVLKQPECEDGQVAPTETT